MQLIKMKKEKILLISSVSILLLALFAQLAFSDCPTLVNTPKQFRLQLRSIVLDYLTNPAPAPGKFTKDDVLDLMNFYKERKTSQTIEDCQEKGSATNSKIGIILKKKPRLTFQCSDGVDNDKDGKIDMADPDCSNELGYDQLDNSESPQAD